LLRVSSKILVSVSRVQLTHRVHRIDVFLYRVSNGGT
jgi:hypothetical protein